MTPSGTVRQNGLAIRALREKDGWTLVALAEYLGVVKSTVSKIENEQQRVQASLLNQIARALCVPVGALVRDGVATLPEYVPAAQPQRRAS